MEPTPKRNPGSGSSGSLMGFGFSQPWKENKTWQSWRDWLKEGRERIDIVVDSGASTSMLPKDIAKDHPTKPGQNRS